jgi:hypothetical protein
VAEAVEVVPMGVEVEVVLALDALPPAFHGHPADRIIVATARVYGLALATHERAPQWSRSAVGLEVAYASQHVPGVVERLLRRAAVEHLLWNEVDLAAEGRLAVTAQPARDIGQRGQLGL